MTKEDVVTKNIGLTFDFSLYLIDNPSEIERLPEYFEINAGEIEYLTPKGMVDKLAREGFEPVQKKELVCEYG